MALICCNIIFYLERLRRLAPGGRPAGLSTLAWDWEMGPPSSPQKASQPCAQCVGGYLFPMVNTPKPGLCTERLLSFTATDSKQQHPPPCSSFKPLSLMEGPPQARGSVCICSAPWASRGLQPLGTSPPWTPASSRLHSSQASTSRL